MKQANGPAAANLEALKVLEKLEALTASATKLPLTNRAVLNPADLTELCNALKKALPAGITEAQQIIRFKDSILTQAHAEAKKIRAEADEQSLTKVGDTQVVPGREGQRGAYHRRGARAGRRGAGTGGGDRAAAAPGRRRVCGRGARKARRGARRTARHGAAWARDTHEQPGEPAQQRRRRGGWLAAHPHGLPMSEGPVADSPAPPRTLSQYPRA